MQKNERMNTGFIMDKLIWLKENVSLIYIMPSPRTTLDRRRTIQIFLISKYFITETFE